MNREKASPDGQRSYTIIPHPNEFLASLKRLVKRFSRNRPAVTGSVIIGILLFMALFAPWITPHPPNDQYSDQALQPPSLQFFFGTDTIGRDIFSRLVFGTRIALFVGLASMLLATGAGVLLGLVSGYYGGYIDTLIGRFLDALLAFPAVLLAIFIVAVLGPSLVNAIIAVAIVYIPAFGRVTRANVLSLKEKEFIEAARAMGAHDWQIMLQHILRNTLSPIIVQFSLGVGYAILVEAGLSFLGLGVQPPAPSWGSMLGFGRNFMTQAPWLSTFPGLAIFVTVLGFNFLGDGLREALDPRLKEAYR
ncbi:MAG: ABC transporter permease [Chloroflexi bacterium]|nr:ABC transporter permease [Chloroflexota bacterium]